jgi:hypothetical protein
LKVESDAKVDELGVVSLAALVVLGTDFVHRLRDGQLPICIRAEVCRHRAECRGG